MLDGGYLPQKNTITIIGKQIIIVKLMKRKKKKERGEMLFSQIYPIKYIHSKYT